MTHLTSSQHLSQVCRRIGQGCDNPFDMGQIYTNSVLTLDQHQRRPGARFQLQGQAIWQVSAPSF